MIPEKGKTYHIEFLSTDFPSYTWYSGPGIYTGETGEYGSEVIYKMKIVPEWGVDDGSFEEKYILREIPARKELSIELSPKEMKDKIKKLQYLLYAALDYVRSEKAYRTALEGPHERLDREADKLTADIESMFTEEERKAAHEEYMKE